MRKIDIACIIDDDPIYVFGVQRLINIKQLCPNLLVFEDGEDALKYLSPIIANTEMMPDVILLDINMPVMDGWEFMDEFVKIKPKIKKKVLVYMVSSSINFADIARAKGYSEITDYMVKPLTLADLERILVVAE